MLVCSKDLKMGDHFRDKIDESIRRYDKLLIVRVQDGTWHPHFAAHSVKASTR